MPSPYPSFRQLAALCRAQSADASQSDTARMLLELACEYEEQAQAEEAGRHAPKGTARPFHPRGPAEGTGAGRYHSR